MAAEPEVIFAFDYDVSPRVRAQSEDMIAYLSAQSGLSLRMEHMPLIRMHRFLRTAENACSLWVFRIEVFEPHYTWLNQSTAPLEISMYRRDDASGAELEAPPMLPRGTIAEEWAVATEAPYFGVTERRQIIDMLLHKRSAAWIDATVVIEAILEEHPTLAMTRVRTLDFLESWMVCSRTTSKEIVDRLSQAWETGLETGGMRSIFDKNGNAAMFPE